MQNANDEVVPVRAKVALIDSETMEVVWANESWRGDDGDGPAEPASLPTMGDVLPAMDPSAVRDTLVAVAEDGRARHLSVGLVSTAKGSVAIQASIYRLPDGMLLVVSENAWQPSHERRGDGSRTRHRRR